MQRRYFFLSPWFLTQDSSKRRSPARKIVVMLVDGFGPDYIESSDMPNLKRMMRSGMFKIGDGVIPSVTNVNNASLITASFPADHGITSNFFYDPINRKYEPMEDARFLLRPTLFERARKAGLKTALVSAKDKVRTLLARGVDVQVSAEKPDPTLLSHIGPAPGMYSPESNYWTLKAARHVLNHSGVDVLYLSTTDYMMHTYAPAQEPSLTHLHTLDRLLADIIDDHPNLELYLTADHGMSAKTEAIDLGLLLKQKGIDAEAVPIIRDKHVVHHNNLGGACYVYLHRPADLSSARDVLKEVKGVEDVFDREHAARLFHLHPQRIGDLFVLGERAFAFGPLLKPREPVTVRTHGSRHEAKVPLLVYGRKVDPAAYEFNFDLTRQLHFD